MSYPVVPSLTDFCAALQPGDVLCYETLTPQGGLIQFADRRSISHISTYVGDGEVVDASSSTSKPGPIRCLKLASQFPAARDKGASDLVTANRSLVALRHRDAHRDPEIGARAAAIARKIFETQKSPSGQPWKFEPNDLLVLVPLVLDRSFQTAYQHSPFIRNQASRIRFILKAIKLMVDPGRVDYRKGVTCSELAHRILRHRKLKLPLTSGADGRPALQDLVRGVRGRILRYGGDDKEIAGYVKQLDWQGNSERRSQLGESSGLKLDAGEFDESDLITPGDIWGFPELLPIVGFVNPMRAADNTPC